MFDEEGFYKIGDAGRFVDPGDPSWGLIFDGRVVEDFKLTSGTFVLVGTLRTTAIAAASPVLQDAVVCGEGRDHVGLLGFPNFAACRKVAGDDNLQLSNEELLKHPAVVETVRDGLARMNAECKGSSHPGPPRAADGRAAVGRRQRDHRQGLHQPARHAASGARRWSTGSMPAARA